MNRESSAASPNALQTEPPYDDLSEPLPEGWSQEALFPASALVVRTTIVVDGPRGMMSALVDVSRFWDDEQIALEALPALEFPRDQARALLWIEERVSHFLNTVCPF